MTTVATTVPTASALRARPQPSAPSAGARLETNGPSTPSAPNWIALSSPKTRTTTQSHVRDENSDHPSRSSVSMDVRSGARAATRLGAVEVDLGAIPDVTDHVPVPFTGDADAYVAALASHGLRAG